MLHCTAVSQHFKFDFPCLVWQILEEDICLQVIKDVNLKTSGIEIQFRIIASSCDVIAIIKQQLSNVALELNW